MDSNSFPLFYYIMRKRMSPLPKGLMKLKWAVLFDFNFHNLNILVGRAQV